MYCDKTAFDSKIVNIAYSVLDSTDCPINTMEHYLTACKLGFNALKGDVRPTADGGLVMCHDVGFTLDENNRIIKFDRGNHILISEMTLEQVLALEHEQFHRELGHYAHPCTFEQFVEICKEYGMICHPTIRDENMKAVVPEVLNILNKYSMRSRTILNSMTLSSLHTVREYDKEIMVCYTLPGRQQITRAHVDDAAALGNAVLDGFNYPFPDAREKIEAASEAIAYARERDVRLFQAQIPTYKDYRDAIGLGFVGFHITRPFLPYTPVTYTFQILVKEGKAFFANSFQNGERYRAKISVEEGKIIVNEIALTGSDRGFADGIMPVWMEALPCQLQVKGKNQTNVNIDYFPEDCGIHISHVDLETDDVLQVFVTV